MVTSGQAIQRVGTPADIAAFLASEDAGGSGCAALVNSDDVLDRVERLGDLFAELATA